MKEIFFYNEEIIFEDFNHLFYDEFLKNTTVVFLETNLSKNQFKRFKKKIESKSFYPIHLIKIGKNDTEKTKQIKLKTLQKYDKRKFLNAYIKIVEKQFEVNNVYEIFEVLKSNIKNCPFCRSSDITTINDIEEYIKSNNEEPQMGIFCNRIVCNFCKEQIFVAIESFKDCI